MTAIFCSQRETLAAQHASSDILSPVTNVTHSTGFPASYLDCLLSSALLRTKVNISHLLSAGRQLIRNMSSAPIDGGCLSVVSYPTVVSYPNTDIFRRLDSIEIVTNKSLTISLSRL